MELEYKFIGSTSMKLFLKLILLGGIVLTTVNTSFAKDYDSTRNEINQIAKLYTDPEYRIENIRTKDLDFTLDNCGQQCTLINLSSQSSNASGTLSFYVYEVHNCYGWGEVNINFTSDGKNLITPEMKSTVSIHHEWNCRTTDPIVVVTGKPDSKNGYKIVIKQAP